MMRSRKPLLWAAPALAAVCVLIGPAATAPGAGGYAVTPGEEVGKSYMAKIASSGSRLGFKRFESGYVRATLTAPAKGDPTLRFEYRSVKPASNAPDDVCTTPASESPRPSVFGVRPVATRIRLAVNISGAPFRVIASAAP